MGEGHPPARPGPPCTPSRRQCARHATGRGELVVCAFPQSSSGRLVPTSLLQRLREWRASCPALLERGWAFQRDRGLRQCSSSRVSLSIHFCRPSPRALLSPRLEASPALRQRPLPRRLRPQRSWRCWPQGSILPPPASRTWLWGCPLMCSSSGSLTRSRSLSWTTAAPLSR